MRFSKHLKDFVNLDYFEFPCKKVKSKFLSLKFHLTNTKVDTKLTEIFICNKTSPYDKYFVSSCLENNFLILKDSAVQTLYNNNFEGDEVEDIAVNLLMLKKAFISVVIFPERHQSVIGDYSNVPDEFIDFIYDLDFDGVSFINLIGTYFIRPIWASHERICDTKIEKRFFIAPSEYDIEEFREKYRKYTPSSASVYSKKIPVFLRGNKLAENFESFLYVCPNCNQFFSIISEFSCLKCHNCGTAFEFSNSGEIDLCKHFSTIDEASEFQYSLLSSIKPSFDRLFSYNNLKVKDFFTNSTTQYMECPSFEIYQNKIDFVLYDNKTTIPFESLIDVYIDY